MDNMSCDELIFQYEKQQALKVLGMYHYYYLLCHKYKSIKLGKTKYKNVYIFQL